MGVQLGDQLGRAGRVRAPPRGEDQVPDAVLGHQVPGQLRAQTTGAAGDQHRAVEGLPGPQGERHQPRHEHRAAADRHLGLDRSDHARERGLVDVQQHDPVRVLRLRRAHQAGHGCLRRVDVLAGHRHRAGRDDEQAVPLARQELLEVGQHTGHDVVQVAGRHDQHLGVRVGRHVVGGRGRPLDAVQRVRGLAVDPVGTDLAQHQRVDPDHRRPGAVRGRDRHRAAATGRRDPGPQYRGARGEQAHAAPGERQRAGPGLADPDRVQHGVQQRRVHAEPGGVALFGLGQGDLGVHVFTVAPRGRQALEHRPVGQSALGQLGVEVGHVQRGRTGRRPGRQVEVRCPGLVGDETGDVGRPAHVLAVRSGEHGDGATAVLVLADRHVQADAAALGQDEGFLEQQLLQVAAADLVTRADDQLDQRGPRHHDGTGHDVVAEPAVRGHREPCGGEDSAVGHRQHRAQQRVSGRVQASRRHVADRA